VLISHLSVAVIIHTSRKQNRLDDSENWTVAKFMAAVVQCVYDAHLHAIYNAVLLNTVTAKWFVNSVYRQVTSTYNKQLRC